MIKLNIFGKIKNLRTIFYTQKTSFEILNYGLKKKNSRLNARESVFALFGYVMTPYLKQHWNVILENVNASR